jgi:hypothetical protein
VSSALLTLLMQSVVQIELDESGFDVHGDATSMYLALADL